MNFNSFSRAQFTLDSETVSQYFGARLQDQPHPDTVAVAAIFGADDVLRYDQQSLADARASVDAVVGLQTKAKQVAEVRDTSLFNGDTSVSVRVYHPCPGKTLPIIVYFHGGGWTIGSVQAADRPCRRIAVSAEAVVVSVEYRLAPEHPFPLPYEDCLSATQLIATNASSIGGDVDRLVLMGDSAGANLAAAVAHTLADSSEINIAGQILLYPCLLPSGRGDFDSYVQNAAGPILSAKEMSWFWDMYLSKPEDGEDSRASPYLAKNFAAMPPSKIVVAEMDILRDEGLAYAERLREAGVPVDVTLFHGAPHGFYWLDGVLSQAIELDAVIADWVKQV